MFISISGYRHEGENANSMHLHASEGEAKRWAKKNPRGDYTKLMRLQPDGSFKYVCSL
jgi:hypothetical protein